MLDHSNHSEQLDHEGASTGEEQVSFDLQGVVDGVKKSIPVAISVFAYGLVFGVLARQAGLTMLEALLMSGLVYAGASQFVALGLWAMPLPVGAIILTTLIVNLRHLLMGASVSPWFSRLPFTKVYGTLFFLSDESWALLMGEFARGKRNAAFLLGSGAALYVAWVSAALVGRTLGGVIQDPAQWGLDFTFTAVFIALLVGLWRGKKDILPWIVAAIVATAAAHWLPGKWYILLGALAGSLIGVARHAD
jgi:4-azaleucine resistance transporter AzlC